MFGVGTASYNHGAQYGRAGAAYRGGPWRLAWLHLVDVNDLPCVVNVTCIEDWREYLGDVVGSRVAHLESLLDFDLLTIAFSLGEALGDLTYHDGVANLVGMEL